ncbi:hypothetical protein CYMTET_25143 [Cymbomonas tetramitiformis]|uniref:beta-galactoside alpha-(2,6)-sialyltransferase n=1 Tax=Cymbomonas tetramitiformis TaxID=36881 RepID=A0AAE0FUS3_9CHLO|nr:hypothetical protein CYMTET_25143 [Cymbomonas tetramitiformis]
MLRILILRYAVVIWLATTRARDVYGDPQHCSALFEGPNCSVIKRLPRCMDDVYRGGWYTLHKGSISNESTVASCALVSNGHALRKHRYGKIIDGHHVVVRLNNGPTRSHEAKVGSKTTIRFTNSAYQGFREMDEEAVLAKFCKGSVTGDCARDPELPLLLRKKVHPLNPNFIDYARSSYWNLHSSTPTSGYVAMLLLLHHCQHVSIFGFMVGATKYDLKQWYFNKRPDGKPLDKTLWLRLKTWTIDTWQYADTALNAVNRTPVVLNFFAKGPNQVQYAEGADLNTISTPTPAPVTKKKSQVCDGFGIPLVMDLKPYREKPVSEKAANVPWSED